MRNPRGLQIKAGVILVVVAYFVLGQVEMIEANRCAGGLADVPMGCCPTEMLPYCCVGITRPCNETIYLQTLVAMSQMDRAEGGVPDVIPVPPGLVPVPGPGGGGGGGGGNTTSGGSPSNNVTYSNTSPYPWYNHGGIDVRKFSSAVGRRNQSANGTKVKPFCVHPWNSSACQDGFFFDPYDQKVKPCPAGFYCPANQLCVIPCPEGAYCASNKVVKATGSSSYLCRESGYCCLPSNVSPVYDSKGGQYICPGPSRPEPCPGGKYCPNVTLSETCPDGKFCRQGSVEPQDCPMLTYCSTGISAPISSYAGPIMIIVVLLGFLLIVFAFNHRRAIRFYADLYCSRYVTRNRRESQAFHVRSGLKLAIDRFTDLEMRRNKITPKEYVVDIEFEDLSLTLKGGSHKSVLMGVTGKINSGEVTAVMGPSGAGKTTFLNTLSGKAYYGNRGGTIKINGTNTEDLDVFRTITGFVPQEDVMHRNLTVKEVLWYQAELRLPGHVPKKQREQKVKQVIEILDLDGVQDSQIGDEETRGVSGGQRKRVNIGMELVADPTLLFLDEPTSGLDSTSSLAVMNALKAVAEKGRLTVMCVIHQPRYEIFSMFHNLLFLGSGGRTVFQGGVDEADAYFAKLGIDKPKNVNPADFYMDVIGGVYESEGFDQDQLFQEYKQYQMQRDGAIPDDDQNEGVVDGAVEDDVNVDIVDSKHRKPSDRDSQHIDSVELKSYKRTGENDEKKSQLLESRHSEFHKRKMPNFFMQLWTFLRREVRLQIRIVQSLLIDQVLVMLAGAILGALHSEISLGSMLSMQTLSALAIGLTAMLSSLRCFGNHRTQFWRESASGVNRFSYFVAVNFAQLPIIVVTPLVYLSLLYTLTSPRAFFVDHYVATLATQFACTGTGYWFSTIFNPKNSQMASVVYVLINALLSGSSPTLCSLDKYSFIGPAFYNLSFGRWYLEALIEKEAIRHPRVLSPLVNHIANRNGYTLRNYWVCIVALFALGIGFRLLAYISLVLTNRGKQK